MPLDLWELVETHATTTLGDDRSSYIRALVQDNLRTAGKLGSGSTDDVAFYAKIGKAIAVGGEKATKRIEKVARQIISSSHTETAASA